jgi:hypothetical protein
VESADPGPSTTYTLVFGHSPCIRARAASQEEELP